MVGDRRTLVGAELLAQYLFDEFYTHHSRWSGSAQDDHQDMLIRNGS